jgi:hypothetical protein
MSALFIKVKIKLIIFHSISLPMLNIALEWMVFALISSFLEYWTLIPLCKEIYCHQPLFPPLFPRLFFSPRHSHKLVCRSIEKHWKTFCAFFAIFFSQNISLSLTINKTKTSVAITKVSLLFGLIKMSWKCCSKWLFVKVVLFYKLLFSKLVSYQLVFCLVYLTIHGNNAADCCWYEGFFCFCYIFF